ncbi:hypothetical protein SAMN05216582_10540 [Selenomonas ruminantium]|uniref:Uncharacterized protein n=1 Tax=Selenomonas ruminantium TaxID=971 RepID=A0A1M6SS97_SELRU|nr:hypothetical protein [Selenomonas ruminantium]SHK47510.1 hypothetical protein SAMN05216582_10540 [Selenomonas ruminantium]
MSTLKSCLDWKNGLASEEDRGQKYMLFLMLLTFVQFCTNAATVAPDNALSFLLLPATLLEIVLSLAMLVLSVYIFYQNKVWHFLFRLVPCTLVSLILLGIVQALLGPAGLAIWVIAAIYVNRHYFKPIGKYQGYIFYYFACIVTSMIAGVFITYTAFSATSSSAIGLSMFMGMLVGLGMTALLWRLMAKEIANGRTFYEALRIATLIPVAFMFLLIGLLTFVPVKFFSGKHLFGEKGHDYLMMPKTED